MYINFTIVFIYGKIREFYEKHLKVLNEFKIIMINLLKAFFLFNISSILGLLSTIQ